MKNCNRVEYKNYVFYGSKIYSISTSAETSLEIMSLSLDSFTCDVKCYEKSILQFKQNDPISLFYNDVKLGVYYMQSIKRVGTNRYRLQALSAVGRLAQRDHLGGIYTGQPVEDVVAAICGDIPFIIKSNLLGTKIYNWLPIANSRDNLKEVLFVLGANLWQDHNGVLRISALWDGLASVVDADRVYVDGASVRTDKPVTAVTVLEHQYIPGKERMDLFNGTATQGQRIPFDGPMSALEAEGFTILDSGANYAVVSAGSGTLTGCPYIHTTLEVTKQVSTGPIKNEVRIEEATLVSLVNSAAVVGRLVNYYACRDTIQVDAVLRQEHPGEVVQIIHPYDRTMVKACISASEVEFSATLKGSLTALVGFAPEQSGDSEYFDERVLLTGEGDWIPPDGTAEITGVAVSGAAGGWSGKMGQQSKAGTQKSDSSTWERYTQISTGEGGDGGEPGAGGEGGRILRFAMAVQPGIPIHYKCGVGGAPGEANTDRLLPAEDETSQPGQLGTDTTFGDLTTAGAPSSPEGYFDPVTGETYGGVGDTGIQGGKGGSRGDGNAASQVPGPDVIYKGVAYHGGPNHEDSVTTKAGWLDINTGVIAGGFYGAGGGAAAGADGKQSEIPPSATIVKQASLANSSAVARGGPGGQGADAVAPDPETVIGKGGKGGNGGGGVGGSGLAEVVANLTGSKPGPPSLPGKTEVYNTFIDGSQGMGSDGSQGGPGGIILYYRRKKKINAGAFVTQKKNFFIDKSGRLIIV